MRRIAAALGLAAGLIASQAQAQYSVVWYMLDDATYRMLEHMPITVAKLRSRSVIFDNAFTTDSICAPSRAEAWTGMYVFNNGVETCEVDGAPNSGWTAFQRVADKTLAPALKARGVRTGFIGKLTNDTRSDGPIPGWDFWRVWTLGTQNKGYGYTIDENGTPKRWGYQYPRDFAPKVLTDYAVQFITNAKKQDFLLVVAPSCGHASWPSEPQDKGVFDDVPNPAVIEDDLSDKPSFVQDLAAATPDNGGSAWTRYLESLQPCDRSIGRIYDTLVSLGIDQKTYFIVTSDQGYHFGEHGLPGGKNTGYDTDTRIPLMIRVPEATGVPAGTRHYDELVTMVDIPFTILRIFGATIPTWFDGRPLMPFLNNATGGLNWREAIPVSHYRPAPGEMRTWPGMRGVRTKDWKLMLHDNGECELYDEQLDPAEVGNLCGVPLQQPKVVTLTAKTNLLFNCAGPSCRQADQ